MVGILVHGNNHFILSGPVPDEAVALALARHWSIIEQQTKGALRFSLAALYPMLYRMEQHEWIRGAWETSGNGRRKRCYRLTPAGRKKLSPLRREWAELFRALQRLTKVAHA
jgi:DNA-binding PadR family transcriptional regulator